MKMLLRPLAICIQEILTQKKAVQIQGDRENDQNSPPFGMPYTCLEQIFTQVPFLTLPYSPGQYCLTPLTQLHLSWVGCSMNNSPSCDLYPFKGERGSFARYPSTYKCIWHNCWDTAALT